MKRIISMMMAVGMGLTAAHAQYKTEVTRFSLAGPFAVMQPLVTDSVNAAGKTASQTAAPLDGIAADTPPTGTWEQGDPMVSHHDEAVCVLSFYLNNSDYLKGTISVKHPTMKELSCQLFIDGKKLPNDELQLAPEHHTVALKIDMVRPFSSSFDSLSVVIDANHPVQPTLESTHPYTVHDLTDGRRVRNISLSPDGQYAALAYQTTERGGDSHWTFEVRDVKTQRLVCSPARSVRWMPRTRAYIEEVEEGGRRMLYQTSPDTGTRTLLASDLPKGNIEMSPTEDFLIITATEEGTKEDADVFEVVEMDDRQPGWRDRTYLVKYSLKNRYAQRLTFGAQDMQLADISADGTQLLITSSHSRLERRPTSVTTFCLMNLRTLRTDTLLLDTEFTGQAMLSPDATKLLIKGTPEAFQRAGCQLPAHVTPSMTEGELFLFDIATRQVTPLTKDFDPSVSSVLWSQADGQIYFSAEDRDYVRLYRLNPQTGAIAQLPTHGDYAYRWDVAAQAPVLGYLAYETMAPASAYVYGKGKDIQLFDGHTALGEAQLGTCQDWNFTNSKGDTVYGRLYLPHDFDATKKYPMIVYYYGGCSPVSRYFESPYAPQMWNSLGYVAYILQPSGATGFGQEWASRHVNTAGHGPAEDIIEGTRKICEAHPFINKDKIGCMGASYGGFMTQYLQTVTDIFAAAVSHAGIANHTSYWGEGYWGYNYSEVSMANSYPWSHRELYVDQSPLFRADKIHTPLLLLHGTADTNVPLIESLQMFTALKLLGREVALVEVKGENHHVLDYGKREKWIATQMAWFQRWLKDDPSWWDALYPKKHL